MRAKQCGAPISLARKLFRRDCNGSTGENRCGSQDGEFCRNAPRLARGIEDRGRAWWKANISPGGSDFGSTACFSCDKSQSQDVPNFRQQATRSGACLGSSRSKALDVRPLQSAFGMCSVVIPQSRLRLIASGSESGESFGGTTPLSLAAPHKIHPPFDPKSYNSMIINGAQRFPKPLVPVQLRAGAPL
jgi:hypothetical protein